jgi:hypothetical protein
MRASRNVDFAQRAFEANASSVGNRVRILAFGKDYAVETGVA